MFKNIVCMFYVLVSISMNAQNEIKLLLLNYYYY